MTIKHLLMIVALAIVSMSVVAGAPATEYCTGINDDRCFTLYRPVVSIGRGEDGQVDRLIDGAGDLVYSPYLSDLVNNQVDYHEWKSGRDKGRKYQLATSCVRTYLVFWNVNLSGEGPKGSIFDNSLDQTTRKGRPALPLSRSAWPMFETSLGEPTVVFEIVGCNRILPSISLPRGFFRSGPGDKENGTYVLLCSPEADGLLWPKVSEGRGTYLTPGTLPVHMARGNGTKIPAFGYPGE